MKYFALPSFSTVIDDVELDFTKAASGLKINAYKMAVLYMNDININQGVEDDDLAAEYE